MNPTELIDQFVVEARECLDHIGVQLLALEKAPRDADRLNDLFRQVHTLKGNCGLFDFKALEQVVHAGEDLLDRVRSGLLPYGPEIADALLDAMDYTGSLVDAIAEHGALPAGGEARAAALAGALRALIPDGRPAVATPAQPAAAPPAQAETPPPRPATDPAPAGLAAPDTATPAPAAVTAPVPAWLAALPAEACQPGHVALQYAPEPECFFKGEDPWRQVNAVPGLQHLAVAPLQPWPDTSAFDCYRCNLVFTLTSDAAPEALAAHFRYVPEQVQTHVLAAPGVTAPGAAAADAPAADLPAGAAGAAGGGQSADAPKPPLQPEAAVVALMRDTAARLWQEQRRLLARPQLAPGTVEGARMTLTALLAFHPGNAAQTLHADLAKVAPDAAALAAWAQRHDPAALSAPCAAGSAAAAPAVPGAPAPAAPTAPTAAAPAGSAVATLPTAGDEPAGTRMLKVAQDKIDRLMDLIGEMVVAKNALPYLAERAEGGTGPRELAREIKNQYAVINRIAEDMQHAIMQVRMLPVGTVFRRFDRLVRDISRKLGKDVRLVVEGEDTEADKNVIESLADPLIHILRNSLDHGIEMPDRRESAGKPRQGTLGVRAWQEGDRVWLEIADDGAGIDIERVRRKAIERGLIPGDRADALSAHETAQLVFLPGFSTADAISDLSGRGVGMDVVRSAVERINGSVELHTEAGRGTTIRLSLPLSMAVTNVMMIEAAGRRFGLPMDLIVETVRVPAGDIHHFKQAQTVVLRGRIVPLRGLGDLLALDAPPRPNADGELAVLVVRLGGEPVGLVVDEFHGTSDIILKPLEGVLAGITGFAGTALMGDGSVLMILNPKELL